MANLFIGISFIYLLVCCAILTASYKPVSLTPKASSFSNSYTYLSCKHAAKDLLSSTVIVANNKFTNGDSDVLPSIFNLAKTILGAGVLSLPSGVAAFSSNPSALYVSSSLLLIMGIMSAYSFSSIGKACKIHNTNKFSEAWYVRKTLSN